MESRIHFKGLQTPWMLDRTSVCVMTDLVIMKPISRIPYHTDQEFIISARIGSAIKGQDLGHMVKGDIGVSIAFGHAIRGKKYHFNKCMNFFFMTQGTDHLWA